ncbi:hypothetical protein RRSWK_00521 [Rhodopirellula sp. SWK7]|nr:hypothetical protein RRSWK_00521 [Rhodopirellula sp. SWK7]
MDVFELAGGMAPMKTNYVHWQQSCREWLFAIVDFETIRSADVRVGDEHSWRCERSQDCRWNQFSTFGCSPFFGSGSVKLAVFWLHYLHRRKAFARVRDSYFSSVLCIVSR